jgi:4-amino-4-deoxy-L-arabinose transferase-like glycosyltransferase
MRRIDPYLLGILLLAAVARFWGLGFGLPYIDARPDETTITTIAVGFFSGDFNPHFFNYPTFYIYCVFLLYYGVYLCGLLRGQYQSPTDFALYYAVDPASLLLLDRGLSALLGTLTVFVVYKITRELCDRRTALVASFFLALAHLHVRDSHFGVTDVAATFLIMCAVLFVQRSYADQKSRSYVYAGLLAGLAASAKYAGALVVAPMCFLYGLNLWTGKGSWARRIVDWRILAFLSALAAAFVLGSPYALLDYARFRAGLQFEMNHLLQGHLTVIQKGWMYHLRFSLLLGLGWSLFAASLAGIVLLLRKDWRRGVLICSFPLLYYIMIGRGYTVFLRYAIPLVPFLCITGAVTAIVLGDAIGRRVRAPQYLVTALLAALIVLPSARSVLWTDVLLARKDTRLLALEWMKANIPDGASVYMTPVSWRGPTPLNALELLRKYPFPPPSLAAAYPTAPFSMLPRYDEWKLPVKPAAATDGGKRHADYPRYLVIRESALKTFDLPVAPSTAPSKEGYQLRQSFIAIDPKARGNWFDQQDAFYVPFAGFRGVKRPGPNIYVYERVPANSFSAAHRCAFLTTRALCPTAKKRYQAPTSACT